MLDGLSDAEAQAYLTGLPGVGPKTAACVLLFSLGRPVMPVDTHVHRVAGRLGILAAGVTAEQAHPILTELAGPRDAHAGLRRARGLRAARPPHLPRPPAGLRRVPAGRHLPVGVHGLKVLSPGELLREGQTERSAPPERPRQVTPAWASPRGRRGCPGLPPCPASGRGGRLRHTRRRAGSRPRRGRRSPGTATAAAG